MVSSPLSLVSTSNVMLLSFSMTNGNKSFRGHFETLAEESMRQSSHTYLSFLHRLACGTLKQLQRCPAFLGCLSQIETHEDPDVSGHLFSPFHPSLLPPQCSCTWRFKVVHTRSFRLLLFKIHDCVFRLLCHDFSTDTQQNYGSCSALSGL